MDNWYIKDILGSLLAVAILAVLWWIIDKFQSTEVTINIGNDSIDFITNKNKISLKPTLYISTIRKNRMLSVGEDFKSDEPNLKIDIINYKGEVGGSKEYHEILSAYFREAFHKVIGRTLFVIPSVRIRGSKIIYENFSEVSESSFQKALKHAGANRIVFM